MRRTAQRPVGASELKKYVSLVRAGGGMEARIIPAGRIVTAEWVRLKCQFGCGGYHKRLCCPPYTPAPERTRRLLGDYRRALIYTYSGVDELRRRNRMMRFLAGLERTIFLDGYYKAFAMGAGPCRLCAVCDTGQRCKYPYLARPALEACGIDVYATCRNVGIKLAVVTSYDAPTKYVNLILID
jgi:predicted metal-binding protein